MKPSRKPLFPTSSIRYSLAQPLALAFAAVLTLGSQSALAALTWDSAGPSNNWSTAGPNTNWNPGGVVWTQNESAVFDAGAEAVNVTTANTFNDITFNISGFSLTSSGGGSLLLANDLASTITVTNLADSASIGENLVNNAGGASALTKAGLGTLTLNGTSANTYSGGTTISAGTLVSSQNTNIALLGTGAVSINPSATLNLTNTSGSADTTVANAITSSGAVTTTSGTRALNITGDLSGFTGNLAIGSSGAGKIAVNPSVAMPSGATVTINSGATLYSTGKTFTNNFTAAGTGNTENRGAFRLDSGCLISGNIALTADTSIGTSGSSASTISGIISGSGFGIRGAITGTHPIILSGPNTFTGKATVTGGNAFSVSSINNSGNAGNLGTNGTIDFGATTTSGTLIYTGAGEITDRVINLAGTTGGATITQSGTNLLKISGGVTAPGTAAADNRKTLTLNGTSAGQGELSGSIPDSTSGTVGQLATSITKSGSGTWTLSGNNSFTGGVTISEGNLVITNSNALGVGPKTITINADANKMLHLDNQGGADITLAGGANALNFTTSGVNGVIRNVAGNNTIAGAITMGSGNGNTKIISDGGNLLLSGAISANTGTRVLDLSGTSTGEFSGALAFTSSPAISKTGPGTWTLSGNNLSTGNTAVEAGTLVITGTVAGPAVVNGGTLKLDYTVDASKLADGKALIFGGGTLELAGGTHPEVVASTTLTAGTVSNITQTGGGSAKLQLNTVTPNSGALHFSADNIATTDNLNVNGILPWARFGSNWGTNLTNTADGAIVAYTGGFSDLTRLSGVVPNDATKNARIINGGSPGNVTLAAAYTTIGSLLMDASAGSSLIAPTATSDVLSIGGDPGGTIWQTATSGALTIGTATGDGVLTTGLTATATAATLTLLNDSPTQPITINSVIANNGTDVVSLNKGGAGQVILAGNNTFTGTVTTGGGTLTMSGDNSGRPAGTNGLTTINGGATLQLQANAGNTSAGISYALSAEQTANQPLVINSGGLLQLRSDSSLTFAGANNMGGLGSATVNIDVNNLTSGSGNTLALAPGGFAVNTTTINVTGGNGYTLGTGTINNSTNGATLTLNPTTGNLTIGGYTANATFSTTLVLGGAGSNNTVTGAIANPATSGATTLTKSGTSTWTLNGANTFTGNITINAGTLAIGGSGDLTAGTYTGTITNAGAFTYGSSAAQTLTGVISGAGTLTMNGGTTLTLSGASANTYTGVTTLNAGTTIAGKASAFGGTGATAGTVINTSALLDVNSLNLGAEQFTLAGGTIKNNGATDQSNATQKVTVTADSGVGGLKRWDIRGGGLGGGLTVNSGTKLTKIDGNAVVVSGNPILNNGTIQIDTGVFGLHANVASTGSGSYLVNSTGELQIGSYGTAVTVANPVTVNGGVLAGGNADGGASSYNGPITLSPASTATLRATAAFNITNTIGGGGGLNKTEAGTLTVGGATSYSGDTTVSAGTLKMNLASSFADTSAIRLTTGAYLDLTIAGTDTVKELYIDNVKQADGKWGRTGSIAALGADYETALITGDGLLEASGSTYGDWIDTFFPGETDPLIIGKTADPDKDGNNNLAEFGFDGDPSDGSINPKIFVFTTDTDADGDSNKEVVMTAAIRIGAGAFTSAAPSTAASAADDITYSIQGSTTLSSFPTTVNAVTTAIVAGLPTVSSGYSYRSFSLGGSNGLPSKGFLRAGVE